MRLYGIKNQGLANDSRPTTCWAKKTEAMLVLNRKKLEDITLHIDGYSITTQQSQTTLTTNTLTETEQCSDSNTKEVIDHPRCDYQTPGSGQK